MVQTHKWTMLLMNKRKLRERERERERQRLEASL
jgi:hypothetical protein